jgi:hypothetical protein
MLKRAWSFLPLLAIGFLPACNDTTGTDSDSRVVGSGNIITEARAASGFDKLSLEGVGQLIIDQTGDESLTITTDDNILPHLTSEVRDGRLTLGVSDNTTLEPSDDIVYRLTVESLTEIDVSGVGTIEVAGLVTTSLSSIISGVATMTMAGVTDTQHISISGVGNYLAENFQSRETVLDGSGVMLVVVRVSELLDGDVCGGVGSVEYIGDPTVSLVSCGVSVSQRTP